MTDKTNDNQAITGAEAADPAYEIAKLKKLISTQRQRLADDYKTIQGLSSGYDVLHIVDLNNDDEFLPYFVESDKVADEGAVMSNYPDFYSAHKAYVESFCHPDYQARMLRFTDKEKIREALKGKKNYRERTRLKQSNGEYSWNDFVIIKIEERLGVAVKVGIGYINVDDVVTAEQARLRTLEETRMAEQAQKERYNFLINVAHELRTPLTLIIGPLKKFLKTEEISDKGKKTVTRVCQQANRMGVLLNTVLASNKIDEGATVLNPEAIDFNKWIDSSADEFRDEAENHNMTIEVELDSKVDVLAIDEPLCRIVFSNFMINAIKHNDPGTHITVSTRLDKEADSVRVCVKDSGSGIGDIDPAKLFERYYRATEDKTGFGIGLSYSKTIVVAHHGTIGAYNNPDSKGATFWFELPRHINR